jgi:hypothetical protein
MVSSDISGRKISTVDVCPPSAVHQISLLNHQHLYYSGAGKGDDNGRVSTFGNRAVNTGNTPCDQFFTISKSEYRLKFQNNVLFLNHCLKIILFILGCVFSCLSAYG